LDTKTLTICFFKLISRILFQFLAVSLGADASSDNNPQSVDGLVETLRTGLQNRPAQLSVAAGL